MTALVVNASGAYRVTLSRELWRTGALIVAPLIDEWTQDAPVDVTTRARTPHTWAHITAGRLIVTGLAEQALPGLAAAPVDVDVDLLRPGRIPQRVTITIPTGSALPYEPPAIPVASAVIVLAGRVTADAFPHGPIAGAAISVAGVGAPLQTLTVPLALPHPTATALRVRALTPGASRTLAAPVRGRADAIVLASTTGIGAGTVLAIGDDIVTAEATAGSVVLLRTPTATSAPEGATARIQTLGAAGPAVALARAAHPGDALLPATGALAGPIVEIVDGTATEYRRTGLTTDADGRWRLPGVRGIPELDITTTAAGFLADGPRRVPLAPVDPCIVNTSLHV